MLFIIIPLAVVYLKECNYNWKILTFSSSAHTGFEAFEFSHKILFLRVISK